MYFHSFVVASLPYNKTTIIINTSFMWHLYKRSIPSFSVSLSLCLSLSILSLLSLIHGISHNKRE